MATRKTDFKKDINDIGNVGERYILEKFMESNISDRIIDVSDDERFNEFDVDIIRLKDETVTIESIISDFKRRKFLNTEKATAYEIKTDTYLTETGNIAYELMSHLNPGCMARTMANTIIYLGIDNDTGKINSGYSISTKEIRKLIFDNISKVNKNKEIRGYSRTYKDDASAMLLINADFLVEKNIARKIF